MTSQKQQEQQQSQEKVFQKFSKMEKFLDWELQGKYKIIKQVGAGSYGKVVQAKSNSTGELVAIKRFDGIFEDLIDCKRILREITILRRLDHPNVVKIIEILFPLKPETFTELYVVMDYCQSDLKKLFKSPIHLENLHLQTIVYGILCATKYLHSAQVLHRDLKPANVLLNEDCTVKICDFGLARSVESECNFILNQTFFLEASPMISPYKGSKKMASQQEFLVSKRETPKLATPSLSNIPSRSLKQPPLVRQNKLASKTSIKRELTGHVVTRWYRAPEVILLEKEYNAAIDIWSIGCIFAELQGMLKANAATFLDRSPLFPGTSCFPLSPDRNNPIKKGQFPHAKSDQLNIIFSVLGTCKTPKDYDFVTDDKAMEYIKSFNPKKKVNFKDLYPASTFESIDFLNQTICFNPNHRISINEALEHPLFSKIRNKEVEIECEQPITLDFEDILDDDLTEKKLRYLFLEEIAQYHNNNSNK